MVMLTSCPHYSLVNAGPTLCDITCKNKRSSLQDKQRAGIKDFLISGADLCMEEVVTTGLCQSCCSHMIFTLLQGYASQIIKRWTGTRQVIKIERFSLRDVSVFRWNVKWCTCTSMCFY